MSRSKEGHINAGRIETSFKRLLPILDLLKRAPHPLSSGDITKHAYPGSEDPMLNVSTNIGEMRSSENRELGYMVSEAHRWIVKKDALQNDHKPGRFLVDLERALPWHDGRPRYWLIAAPGWESTWTISREGLLLPVRPISAPAGPAYLAAGRPGICGNPACRRPLMNPLGPPYCPGEVCKREYFAALQVKMF